MKRWTSMAVVVALLMAVALTAPRAWGQGRAGSWIGSRGAGGAGPSARWSRTGNAGRQWHTAASAFGGHWVGAPSARFGSGHWHRSHSGSRVYLGVGVPLWWGGWGWGGYPYDYYGPWSPPVLQSAPPVLVPVAPPPPAYWYYCQDPPGYYPYVRSCAGAWTPVAPQPAP